MDKRHLLIDARTDERWVHSVDSLVSREDWDELWALALRTPPIWTVRIIKYLNKNSWSPLPDQQLEFFQTLSKFASACNEFDLPGPDLCQPTSLQLEVTSRAKATLSLDALRSVQPALCVLRRSAAARITADGEFAFILDDKAAAVDVHRVSDLGSVERIRLDMVNGKQHAVLAFAITPMGERLAALTYEARTGAVAIHIYELSEGEILSDRLLACPGVGVGKRIPSMCFDDVGRRLAIQSDLNAISMWNVDTGVLLCQFEDASRFHFEDGRNDDLWLYPVSPDSHFDDWCRYGRRVVAESASRAVALSGHGTSLAAGRGRELMVWGGNAAPKHIACSSGLSALSGNGRFVVTINEGHVFLEDLDSNQRTEIAECEDPLARLAISGDSELLAIAMSHYSFVRVWHLPDGRSLGSLPGLAHDVIIDFRFTTGGSLVAISRAGLVQTWEADGNGNAWPWSRELVQITHTPVDTSSVTALRQAQEMRRRGWLSVQESSLLDLALNLMQQRLNLDIEVDWETELPGDIYDIEID